MTNATLQWQENGQSRSVAVVDRVFIGRVCSGAPVNKRILIEQASVSRDHAVVTVTGTTLSIRDTSRNGTRVNGIRITSGSEHALHTGDCINIGTFDIVVNLSSDAQRAQVQTELDVTTTLSVEEVVTHLVADVRGYSTLAQQHPSDAVRGLLSQLFERFSEAVNRHHGVVKDFAGDAIFAFWEHGQDAKTEMAVRACRTALMQYDELNKLPQIAQMETPLRVGWGIATGRVTLSHYGVRQDTMAVVGDATNLAFRLAGLANKALDSNIVVCDCTAKLVPAELRLVELGEVETKGRTGRETVWSLVTMLPGPS